MTTDEGKVHAASRLWLHAYTEGYKAYMQAYAYVEVRFPANTRPPLYKLAWAHFRMTVPASPQRGAYMKGARAARDCAKNNP